MGTSQEVFVRLRTALSVTVLGLWLAGCATTTGWPVDDATYVAIVPTSGQLATEASKDLPGGFAVLRASGVDTIEVSVEGDQITFRIDDGDPLIRPVTDRFVVQDREGSGPFRGSREVLALGDDPLTIGELALADPVIWPGSFEDSPVITLKSRDEEDRGPAVSCGPTERCLLLTSGTDPVGGYEDANNPQLEENPISTINVSVNSIEFVLDSGEVVKMDRNEELSTNACGLSVTTVWNLADTVELDIEDPVLVHAACPSTPGDIYLAIMERTAIPVLAPLGPDLAGEWCQPGPACLLFVPTG